MRLSHMTSAGQCSLLAELVRYEILKAFAWLSLFCLLITLFSLATFVRPMCFHFM